MANNGTSTILPKVSYSWKNLYEWCPRQYRYAKVDRVTPDRPKAASAIVGNAVHRVVELMYSKKSFSLDYVRGAWPYVFENMFEREKFTFSSPLYRKRQYDKGLEILEKAYLMAEARGMLIEPVAVEWKFAIEVKTKLGRRFSIRGKIDLILRMGNDIWVIDLKTGTWKPSAQELADHSQLTIYHLAVTKLLNLKVTKLMFWYPIYNQLMPTERTERDHEKVINEIEQDQFAIERGEFEPTYDKCHLCAYWKRCKAEDAVKATGVQPEWFYKEPKR